VSASDLAERDYWDDYQGAYEDALEATSTEWAPWHVVPADHKWVTRAVVADVVTTAIRGLDLRYPEVTEEQRKRLQEARAKLDAGGPRARTREPQHGRHGGGGRCDNGRKCEPRKHRRPPDSAREGRMMLTVRTRVVALYVDRASRQWIARDSDGNLWSLPPTDKPWDDRLP